MNDSFESASQPDRGFQFLPPQKSEKPYTVSQINEGISRILESGNTLVWVEGEISNFKQATSGHCYLKLKDETSQIPAVLWKQAASELKFAPAGRHAGHRDRLDPGIPERRLLSA